MQDTGKYNVQSVNKTRKRNSHSLPLQLDYRFFNFCETALLKVLIMLKPTRKLMIK